MKKKKKQSLASIRLTRHDSSFAQYYSYRLTYVICVDEILTSINIISMIDLDVILNTNALYQYNFRIRIKMRQMKGIDHCYCRYEKTTQTAIVKKKTKEASHKQSSWQSFSSTVCLSSLCMCACIPVYLCVYMHS
jgi:mRNA deadenylase 3'-5' endonuclease subunit Ccr4